MPKSVVAIEKYINNASASIIVVNNGEATTAGSKFILDTIKVSDAATTFAKNTSQTIVIAITIAIVTLTLSKIIHFKKATPAKHKPASNATFISFQTTLKKSVK